MAEDSKMDVDQGKISDSESKDKDMKLSDSEKKKDEKLDSPKKEKDHGSSDKKESSSKDDKKSSSKDDRKDSEKKSDEDKNKKVEESNSNNKKTTVDREKVCPFLLRVFCKRGSHHRIEDFTINRQPVEDEVQIYTWKDASLREIASLLAEIDPKYAKHGTTISFKAVYLDNIRARYNSKDLGVINISKPSKTDDVTLDDNRFIIGDFIDVALQSYSDVRRRYSYDRQDSFGSGGVSSRLGGRYGGNNIRSVGLSYDRKRKIGERHDRFSRSVRDEGRRPSYRGRN